MNRKIDIFFFVNAENTIQLVQSSMEKKSLGLHIFADFVPKDVLD